MGTDNNSSTPKSFLLPPSRLPGASPSTPPMSTRSAPPVTLPSAGKTPLQEPTKSTTSEAPTGRSSTIQCHRSQGLGHVAKECPSKRAYIVTDDGDYISTSDIEEDNIDNTPVDKDALSLSSDDVGKQHICIVHRVLSTQMEQAERMQRHNLFQTLFVIKDCRARVIIDGGSSNNLVSSDLVKKLGLPTRPHKHSYHVWWLKDSSKVKVTQTSRVHFSLGPYFDFVDCDVVPMEACSLLLGRPWEFNNDAIHHGRSNTYTLKAKKLFYNP
jgi:hypothetical protein